MNLDQVLAGFAFFAEQANVVKLLLLRRVTVRLRPQQLISIVEIAPKVLGCDVALR